LLLAVVLVARLKAGPIVPVPVDATGATDQWLNYTDKLLFTISDGSYQVNASNRGLSPYPTHATFQLLSLPQIDPGEFAAWWEASDGSVITDFPETLSWLQGRYQSSGYTGPVSVLYGSMDLPPNSVPEILVLENLGDHVKIGLQPYTLAQDFTVTFSDGGFGVSGVVTKVQYLDPPVPEPGSGWILLAAGAALCFVPRIVSRIRGSDIK
jgi:hypothetical protein